MYNKLILSHKYIINIRLDMLWVLSIHMNKCKLIRIDLGEKLISNHVSHLN